MGQNDVISLVQDAVMTILTVSLPLLGIGLVVGLIISVLQATTQINEQTVVFVSKILSVFGALILFGPWMLTQLQEFTMRVYGYILTALR
ncbi:MAG: flagellar biosynthesis protein FliQ [Oscillospiraceae bacterium]|nr:flagellar biosynthesis protein FliQ [Oscillospiraceae bacterium]